MNCIKVGLHIRKAINDLLELLVNYLRLACSMLDLACLFM